MQLYLDRIDAVDKNGPTLQAILTINLDALAEAKKLDEMKAAGQVKGPLHGVPILLKDNIETKDNMPTTAGALALKDNVTGRDSPLVAGLRRQGAVILGKANLSQWAYKRSDGAISGWAILVDINEAHGDVELALFDQGVFLASEALALTKYCKNIM